MADCAAAPALFYAVAYVPMAPQHTPWRPTLERLMARPSVARTIDQARPYFKFFPGRSGLVSVRYLDPQSE
jgi:glutathione S-transferase